MISEMIDGIFTYERKLCRALIGTYLNCELKVQLGKYGPNELIDEIVIDYETGRMEICNTSSIKKVIGEFYLDIVIHDDSPNEYSEETLTEDTLPAPSNYMDASLALKMVEHIKPTFDLPDLSGTFGKYIEENRQKDGLTGNSKTKKAVDGKN